MPFFLHLRNWGSEKSHKLSNVTELLLNSSRVRCCHDNFAEQQWLRVVPNWRWEASRLQLRAFLYVQTPFQSQYPLAAVWNLFSFVGEVEQTVTSCSCEEVWSEEGLKKK